MAYIITGLIVGAVVGCVGGLALGWVLALGYHGHGPSDPGDAPVFVTMGLTLSGACLGAVVGLAVSIILCVRSARRKVLNQSS